MLFLSAYKVAILRVYGWFRRGWCCCRFHSVKGDVEGACMGHVCGCISLGLVVVLTPPI